MKSKIIIWLFLFAVSMQICLAADAYKPYLHKPSVPEHPEIRLYGQYKTELFPGAGTYAFPIDVPKGINGLRPEIIVSYNSQNARSRPGIMGAGWYFHQDYIYRDINSTPSDSSDDEFIMILDKIPYQLKYNSLDERWHTEVEYYYKIEKESTGSNDYGEYWLVTKKDGTKYRYGYNTDSELGSNTGRGYAVKWSLDQIEDTHGNTVYYSYLEDPFFDDQGASYIDKIEYNSDLSRKVTFAYEASVRPDRRMAYEIGNKIEESRRLEDISVFADDSLVRRYHLNYTDLNAALSSISAISHYGEDNSSILYSTLFEYHISETGLTNQSTSWEPPVLFASASTDYGVRLIDINNDAFIDIVRKTPSENVVWQNDKQDSWDTNATWSVPENIVDASGVDQGVRFGDVNNDGLVDLIKSKNGARSVYINDGDSWDNDSSWTFPADIVDASGNDQGARLADIDGDGRIDILVSKNGGTEKVYINTGSGWSDESASWDIPLYFYDSGDTGARIVDINGDGLPDIVLGNTTAKKAWLNDGDGWVNYDSIWQPPVSFITASKEDDGVRFADVNGDGLVDIVQQDTYAWLNNGRGWTQDNDWKSPETFISSGKNIGRRIADVNGDGFGDLIVSYGSDQHTWTKDSTLPYMLKKITNAYGGTTQINYTQSTQFDNTEDGISKMGFNIFVVSNVTKNNQMDSPFDVVSSTEYGYSLGKYNYDDSEFRGFGVSTETTSYAVTKHYFYQDDPRRGKEYKTEIYDTSDNLYSRNVKDWNYTFNEGAYNLSLLFSTDYIFDGSESPMVINQSYDYGHFENLYNVTYYGDISVSGDEKIIKHDYAYNPVPWVVNKVARMTVYDTNGNKLKETKYYYDDLGFGGVEVGELTKIEQWDSSGNHSWTLFEYDDYGNLIKKIDPLGDSVKYIYDDTHVYPAREINALGHITDFSYDSAFGNLLTITKNGITTYYEYDSFGRLEKEILPYDSPSMPTKEYFYDFDGTAPEFTAVTMKTTADNRDNVTYVYDGFGNLVQLKTGIENDREVVKNIYYDSEFRIYSEDNPYFDDFAVGLSTPDDVNSTTYSYDCMDRVISVMNPDGTEKAVVFDRDNITDYDENNNNHMYSINGLGRIVKVFEYNNDPVYSSKNETYETTYEYDATGNLIKITDTLGNEFNFTYDSTGRKISTDDPDLGHWEYGYDKNGNLISQTDNRGETVTLQYDALNRIEQKMSDDVTISFDYDGDYYGTLTNITEGDTLISYDYDDRLRVIKETININGSSFEVEYLYDSANRVVSRNGVDYFFNRQGNVRKISDYVDADYNAFGAVLNRTYGNGIVTSFVYDSENNRVNEILSNVQNLSYSYDNVGNILLINDYVNSRLHNMTYDALDRMVRAKVGSDNYTYSYNAIGNILKIQKNDESKKFLYNGTLAHAPAWISDGSAGIDIHKIYELDMGTKDRAFEFFLMNEYDSEITGANFSVDFGDGNSFDSNEGINISSSDSIWVFVQNNYSSGGDYELQFSAASPGISDTETFDSRFGLDSQQLLVVSSNTTERSFELTVYNDLDEQITGVYYNCSEGINGGTYTIPGYNTLVVNISHNYTEPGQKEFSCSVHSDDGDDFENITLTIVGLEISEFDVLLKNGSSRIIQFDVLNEFIEIESNISVVADENGFSTFANISSHEEIMVFAEVNYSSDNAETFEIELITGNESEDYIYTFYTSGVEIENYTRTSDINLNQTISFDIVNGWRDGYVNWSLDYPLESNSSYMETESSNSFSLMHDYLGENMVGLTAVTAWFSDLVKDRFTIEPLEISSFEVLSDDSSVVFEIMASNNLASMQQFDFRLDTGEENITSVDLINVTDSAFVFIEANITASDSVYETTAVVNTTQYNDTANGVVIA